MASKKYNKMTNIQVEIVLSEHVRIEMEDVNFLHTLLASVLER